MDAAWLRRFVNDVVEAHPTLLHDIATKEPAAWKHLMQGIHADLMRASEAGGGASVRYLSHVS